MANPESRGKTASEWAETYRSMFGFVPDMVESRHEICSRFDPDFLDALETLRARAFDHPGLDDKTKQLVAVAVLMSHGRPAAANHMVGARRAGASWDEIHVVTEIVTALGALGPGNQIGNLIKTAQSRENVQDPAND